MFSPIPLCIIKIPVNIIKRLGYGGVMLEQSWLQNKVEILAIFIIVLASVLVWACCSVPLAGLRAAAFAGDTEKQYRLGVMYSMGIDLPKDRNKAAYWFEKAADSGHVSSAYLLASIYMETDKNKAAKWLHTAAEKGYAPAQKNLGEMYVEGMGVTKDPQKGIFWLKKAAAQNSAGAIYALGRIYQTGDKGIRNEEEAEKWWTAGADIGDHRSQYYLGLIKLKDGDIPAAVELFMQSAEKKYPEALYALAMLSIEGKGIDRDEKKALTFLEKASLKGHSEASFSAGMMRYTGRGCLQDYKAAFVLFSEGAELGHIGSLYMRGIMYLNGTGTEKNIKAAEKYLTAAWKAELPEAARELGTMLCEKTIPGKISKKGLEYLISAGKKLDAEAFARLGDIYGSGGDTPENIKKSLESYTDASTLGSARASIILGEKYEYGDGAVRDMGKAVYYYLKAIERSRPHKNGPIPSLLKKDIEGPFAYAKRTVITYPELQKNSAGPEAEYALGMILYYGKGTPANRQRGIALIRSAAAKGSAGAKDMMESLKQNVKQQKGPELP